MGIGGRLRAAVQRHPYAFDALLAACVFALTLFVPNPDGPARVGGPTTGLVLIAALTCIALAGRRRWRVAVLVGTTVGAAAATLLVGHTSLSLAPLIALFTVAVSSDRRSTWLAWGFTATVMTAAGALSDGHVGLTPEALGWSAAAAAVGDALRHRRAYLAAVEERLVRAERTREEEARRRVVEERLRIARELHDVIAHRIAVVSVQAGVASHLLRSKPDAAEEALANVRQASRAVLDEVADILAVLRRPDEPADPTSPAPGLAQVDALVASFAAAGLEVDWSVTGPLAEVDSRVDLAAYRVLQEALTNAHKHGTGSAHITIGYEPTRLALAVTNPVTRLPSASATLEEQRELGNGLIGMRERAAAVGGLLHAGVTGNGTFRVDAQLPLQRQPVG